MQPPHRLAPRDGNHQAAPAQPPEGGARRPGRGPGKPPPHPPPLLPRPAGSRRPTRGVAARHPHQEGCSTQGGKPRPRQALLHAECRQSAGRSLPQCPQQAGGPAPALKGAPWTAADGSARESGMEGAARKQTAAEPPGGGGAPAAPPPPPG